MSNHKEEDKPVGTFYERLTGSRAGNEHTEKFIPVARYQPAMDSLVYINEDCSYRADRVDIYLTLLWHPYEDRLVGIKLKGFKFVFEKLKSIMSLKDEDFLLLTKALELAMVGGAAEVIMRRAEKERIERKYKEACEFARDIKVPSEELLKIAA